MSAIDLETPKKLPLPKHSKLMAVEHSVTLQLKIPLKIIQTYSLYEEMQPMGEK